MYLINELHNEVSKIFLKESNLTKVTTKKAVKITAKKVTEKATWKSIKGYPGYEVSSTGTVRNSKTKEHLRASVKSSKCSTLYVTLYDADRVKKSANVRSLVESHFSSKKK